ncbi:MAG: YeeE/YedE family protein [Halorhodospira sp.]
MVFDSFIAAHWTLLGGVFLIALILGAVANRTNFCTMGAVSDAVNMQDWQRMRAWALAAGVAVLGVGLLEPAGLINAEEATPPYRTGHFTWAGYIVGGLLFGIGMTLASGCANKTLVRLGGGNGKSLIVAAALGATAYTMVSPLPLVDASLRELLFPWVDASALPLSRGQDLGSLLGGDAAPWVRPLAAAALGGGLLYAALRAAAFRGSRDAVASGIVVGGCVLAIWLLSSNIAVTDGSGEQSDLPNHVTNWDFHHPEQGAGRPESARWLGPQGLSFVTPMSHATTYTARAFDPAVLTTGVMAFAGVVLGSLLWALASRTFRLEWFADRYDLGRHLAGGVLMGIGGPLAMGCTFGQGLTGLSTLAVGAMLATASIILGSALTMKVQYYKLLYEEEATLGKALLTGLVDLRLLPSSMRQLDAL